MKKKKVIFKLTTKDWNKQTPRDQDKALLFMYTVLGKLSSNRKTGYHDEFWAEFP